MSWTAVASQANSVFIVTPVNPRTTTMATPARMPAPAASRVGHVATRLAENQGRKSCVTRL